MRAVDTNVLLRLIARDDERQMVSAEAFVQKGAWVSHLVLAETVWVLSAAYHLGHAELATAIEMLLGHEHLTVQDPDVVIAALEQYRRRPALGFSDCLVLEIARKAGNLPLGTFDRNLSRVEGAERLSRSLTRRAQTPPASSPPPRTPSFHRATPRRRRA
jgi:predicted nucleic-acid-binding protein